MTEELCLVIRVPIKLLVAMHFSSSSHPFPLYSRQAGGAEGALLLLLNLLLLYSYLLSNKSSQRRGLRQISLRPELLFLLSDVVGVDFLCSVLIRSLVRIMKGIGGNVALSRNHSSSSFLSLSSTDCIKPPARNLLVHKLASYRLQLQLIIIMQPNMYVYEI